MTCAMKRTAVIISLFLITLPVLTQRSADYGASVGTVTYLGEENERNPFYRPGPAAQLFYRYNFNPRQAVRANLTGAWVPSIASRPMLGELGATYEFNFFPYSTFRSRRVDYTPYIAGGAALAWMNQPGPFLAIPFSAGFKINVANHIGIELEYGFRKTFTDNLDGKADITGPDNITAIDGSRIQNNDWYSFLGLSVTWKMYNMLAGCPAFADMDKEREKKRNRRER